MANEGARGGFVHAGAANEAVLPVVKNIFDVSAEFLGQLKTWLEQNPPSIPITQIIGFTQKTQSVRAAKSALQTLTTGAYAVLTWDVTDFDLPSGGQHSNTTNNSRLTVVVDGRYLVTAFADFATSGAGIRSLKIYKNGVDQILPVPSVPSAESTWAVLASWPPLDLVRGDYLEVYAFQSSGGNLNLSPYSKFSMTRMA